MYFGNSLLAEVSFLPGFVLGMCGGYLATESSCDTSCCVGSLNKSGTTVKECARHSGLKYILYNNPSYSRILIGSCL